MKSEFIGYIESATEHYVKQNITLKEADGAVILSISRDDPLERYDTHLMSDAMRHLVKNIQQKNKTKIKVTIEVIEEDKPS